MTSLLVSLERVVDGIAPKLATCIMDAMIVNHGDISKADLKHKFLLFGIDGATIM